MEKQYTQEYAAKIEQALEDEAMLSALANAAGKAEIVALFADKGIEMDEEMAQDVYTRVHKIGENGELDEEMLDAVNGGVIHILGAIAMIGAGAITFYITVKVGCWIVKKLVK